MPVPGSYTPHEVARQVAASRASFMVGHASAAAKLAATLSILGEELRTVVVGDQAGAGAGDQGRGFLRWADFLAASSGALPAQAEVDLEKDVAVLPFSSGTTGPPKVGAGQTHVSRLVLQTIHRFSQSQKRPLRRPSPGLKLVITAGRGSLPAEPGGRQLHPPLQRPGVHAGGGGAAAGGHPRRAAHVPHLRPQRHHDQRPAPGGQAGDHTHPLQTETQLYL